MSLHSPVFLSFFYDVWMDLRYLVRYMVFWITYIEVFSSIRLGKMSSQNGHSRVRVSRAHYRVPVDRSFVILVLTLSIEDWDYSREKNEVTSLCFSDYEPVLYWSPINRIQSSIHVLTFYGFILVFIPRSQFPGENVSSSFVIPRYSLYPLSLTNSYIRHPSRTNFLSMHLLVM